MHLGIAQNLLGVPYRLVAMVQGGSQIFRFSKMYGWVFDLPFLTQQDPTIP